jgi:2-alkyl-3-oxoalkanoate reductase
MKALVTGGGGFLGRRIVELLRERGDDVVFFARGKYPEVEKCGARGLQIDLVDKAAIPAALDGVDTVFHVAAKAGYWGPIADYRAINVQGTQNLIDACLARGVARLVYTSTPSVHGYDHDIENGGQDVPYATSYESPYPQSKAEAERLVLAANGQAGANGVRLATVALRPHLIFGPGDANLLPRVVSRAKSGALPIVGTGANKVDMTFVDNAAWAHLDAANALSSFEAACAGKAYFISNDEPVVLWDWLGALFDDLGVPRPKRKLPLGLVRALGGAMEAAYTLLPLKGEPRMTRFLANGLAYSHWYDMAPARRDLGYTVRVPMSDATRQTVAWLKGL